MVHSPLGTSLVGRRFGQYHVLSMIQRGGMGEIYLAELEPQKIKIVIKRLQDTHDSDERYVEMFRNEAAVMSELEHPNIVKVLGVPVLEGRQCLVMEFVRGRNLQQVLKKLRGMGRRLPPPIALHVMRKVLLGLSEAHQARFPDGRSLQLVHRDVKPGNILISFAGDVKITDFGIAKSALQQRSTTAGVVKGTVRYLSPEQIRSEPVTPSSDLFSCASVLVEILTDQPLYDRGQVAATLMAILNDDRAPLSDLLPFRAPGLCEVLEKALDKDPERRFASAVEFASALGQAARTLGKPVSDDDLGSLLRNLFQGTAETTADEKIRSGEDVTYLLPADGPPTPAPVSSRQGAQPLDAAAFDHAPVEYLRAEERARAMLEEDVVIESPVPFGKQPPPVPGGATPSSGGGTSSDDLEIDLDELDLGPEELEFEGEPSEPPAPPTTDSLEALPTQKSLDVPLTTFAPEPTPDVPAVSAAQAPLDILRMEVPSGTRIPTPMGAFEATMRPIASVRPSGEYKLLEAGILEEAAEQRVAAEAVASARLRKQLRLVLLMGLLGGVLLTCAVLALGQL